MFYTQLVQTNSLRGPDNIEYSTI